MVIDIILDRRAFERDDGNYEWYGNRQFRYLHDYATYFQFDYLGRALDNGDEEEVKSALCRYIDENGYATEIKEYVRSVKWIPSAPLDVGE